MLTLILLNLLLLQSMTILVLVVSKQKRKPTTEWLTVQKVVPGANTSMGTVVVKSSAVTSPLMAYPTATSQVTIHNLTLNQAMAGNLPIPPRKPPNLTLVEEAIPPTVLPTPDQNQKVDDDYRRPS